MSRASVDDPVTTEAPTSSEALDTSSLDADALERLRDASASAESRLKALRDRLAQTGASQEVLGKVDRMITRVRSREVK